MYHDEPIMIDMDGVMADFCYGYTKIAQAKFGIKLYHDWEQITWDLAEAFGLTKEQDDELWTIIKDPDSHFWFNLEALPDIVTLDRLRRMTYVWPIYFVTKRVGADCKQQTERWLQAHLGGSPASVIVSRQKGRIAKGINAAWAIDDKPSNIKDMEKHVDGLCLYSAPYNRDFSYNWRVNSLEEFLDIVEGTRYGKAE